jgi:hypothetical protein
MLLKLSYVILITTQNAGKGTLDLQDRPLSLEICVRMFLIWREKFWSGDGFVYLHYTWRYKVLSFVPLDFVALGCLSRNLV